MRGSGKRTQPRYAHTHTHTHRPTVWTFCELLSSSFSFSGWNLPGYAIFRTPTKILVVTSPTSYLHITLNAPLSSMPPTQFMQHFRRGHVYLRHQVHFLLFLFPVSDFHSCIDMSKGVLNQYPTQVLPEGRPLGTKRINSHTQRERKVSIQFGWIFFYRNSFGKDIIIMGQW